MSRKCGMPWMKLNGKSYKIGSKEAEHHGNNKAIMCEALKERWSKDKDLDRNKTKNNLYYGYDSGLKLMSDINKEISDLSGELRSNGKRGIRKDAITSFAGIVKPDKEVMEELSPKEQIRFFNDALDLLIDKFGTNPKTGKPNIRSAVIQLDEENIHMHYFGVPYTDDGRLSAKEIFTPKLSRWLNEEFPALMNKKGWNLDICRDTESYQPNVAKTLDEQQLKEYKEKCIEYKKNKRIKHGRNSDEFKIQKEIEKATMQEKQKLKKNEQKCEQRVKALLDAEKMLFKTEQEICRREQTVEQKEEQMAKYSDLGLEYYSRAKSLFANLSQEDEEFKKNKEKLYSQSLQRIDSLHTKLDESLLPQPNKKKQKEHQISI